MSESSIKQYQNEVEKIPHFGGSKETANRNECIDIYTISKMSVPPEFENNTGLCKKYFSN